MSDVPAAPGQPARALVLLLEEDAGVRRALHLLLRAHGFAVRSYEATSALLDDPGARAAEHLVVDQGIAHDAFPRLVQAMRRAGWAGRALLLADRPSLALRAAAIEEGYAQLLEKPVRPHELIAALNGASARND